ncbi:MAG: hypothetical protein ABH879_03140 [archaeon]
MGKKKSIESDMVGLASELKKAMVSLEADVNYDRGMAVSKPKVLRLVKRMAAEGYDAERLERSVEELIVKAKPMLIGLIQEDAGYREREAGAHVIIAKLQAFAGRINSMKKAEFLPAARQQIASLIRLEELLKSEVDLSDIAEKFADRIMALMRQLERTD